MRAFDGIKVLDCTHVIAAPFATYQLAVLGADVIKVEDPNEPDQSREYGSDKALKNAWMGSNYLTQASNKRAIALDLKTGAGREVLKRLAATWADVLVENYRPGAFKALGLGYEELSRLNPKLVYASMSAFGQDGPRGSHTAYDPAIAASSGLTASTGTATSGPIRGPAPVIDYATGMAGAFAIGAALYQRMRTGEGQYIDLSMLDVALMLQSLLVTDHLHTGYHTQRGQMRGFASTQAYDTRHGVLQLSASNLRQMRRLFELIGLPEEAGRSMSEHAARADEERAQIAAKMKEKTAGEWESFLQARRVPATVLRELRDALADPQLASRGLLHPIENVAGAAKPVRVAVAPFKFAHDGPSIERVPPRIGEHTDEVLALAGYGAEHIAALRKARVVA